MTWITPLLALISVAVTLASLTMTPPLSALMVTCLPLTVAADVNFTTCAAVTFPATTWQVSIAASFSLFSGLSRFSTVPAGSFANASLVGAKTVNGPLARHSGVSLSSWKYSRGVNVASCAVKRREGDAQDIELLPILDNAPAQYLRRTRAGDEPPPTRQSRGTDCGPRDVG